MEKYHSFAYVQNLRIPSEFAHSVYIVKTCEATTKLGYRVNLLIPKRIQPKYFNKLNLWQYYQIPENSFVLKEFKVPDFINLPRPIELVYVHCKNLLISWIFSFKSLIYLIKHKIEIIQTGEREIILLLRLCSFFYKPKIIFDVHILPLIAYEKILEKIILPRIDFIVCNCIYFQKYYQEKNDNTIKIVSLPNGYDPRHFNITKNKNELRKKYGLPFDRFIIGFIGRFDTFGYEKGVLEMIKAVDILKKSIPITVVAVGGPESFIKKYQVLCNKIKLNSQEAIILPQVKLPEVAGFIKSFDVACMLYPDIDHFRNKMSPMKAVEYMASDIPIIASDLPSIRQILNGDNSYLIKPQNPKLLAETVKLIYKNYNQAKTKARKAYIQAKKFTWELRQKNIINSIKI